MKENESLGVDFTEDAPHETRHATKCKQRDYSIKILHMLRNSSGLVKDILSAIVVISPDSMTVERSVST